MTTTQLHLPAHLVPGPGKVPVILRIDRLIGQSDLFARWADPAAYEPSDQDHRVYAAHALLAWVDGRPDETILALDEAQADGYSWEDRASVSVDGVLVWEGDAPDLLAVLRTWEGD